MTRADILCDVLGRGNKVWFENSTVEDLFNETPLPLFLEFIQWLRPLVEGNRVSQAIISYPDSHPEEFPGSIGGSPMIDIKLTVPGSYRDACWYEVVRNTPYFDPPFPERVWNEKENKLIP